MVPESFHHPFEAFEEMAFPVGETDRERAGCFPALPPRAVRLPERFRGGCSFGAPTLAAAVALPTGVIGNSEGTAYRRRRLGWGVPPDRTGGVWMGQERAARSSS
ncbi:MAG: hypothetical protein JWM12_2680 [Ilumatobacteraceae bacterium]|jgi:hypothetical protein|nr:hypothetical protein [Ilumatobacteraceae bacterium]